MIKSRQLRHAGKIMQEIEEHYDRYPIMCRIAKKKQIGSYGSQYPSIQVLCFPHLS